MTSTHVSLKTAVDISAPRKLDSADKMSTFCTLPFMHLVIHNSGGYGQCCNANAEIYKSIDGELKISNMFAGDDHAPWEDRIIHGATIQEIFNSEYMQNIRHQLLTNKKPTSCNKCWKLEDNAQDSPRYDTFDKNADIIGLPAENDTINDTLIQNPQVRSLDLKFGNECNLHCLMCNSGNSNQWNLLNKECASYLGTDTMRSPELNFRPLVFPEYSPVLFEEIKSLVPQLQEIQCTGGEPFISKKFITLLEYIIETGHAHHITLEITTNGTKFVTDVMELLAHFRYVRFIVSIDGSGLAYDYVRPPFTYKKLLERCHVLSEYIESGRINATVNIASLCMVYNLFSFPEMVADMHNIFSDVDIDAHPAARLCELQRVSILPFLNGEEHLSIKWLPPELLTMALEFYMSNNTIQDGYFASRYRRNKGDGSWLKMLATYSTDNFSNDKRQIYNIELKRYTLLMDKVLNRDYHDFLDHRICKFLDSIESDL